MSTVRLQKAIADAGICSRRKAEALIADGKVSVNGKVVNEMGLKVDPEADTISIQGNVIASGAKQSDGSGNQHLYIALNKPVDFITSTTDEQGISVVSLLKKENAVGKLRRDITTRVYPVGRLDKESEGLVLLTNDGELANTLTHPRYEHEKEYEVIIGDRLTKDAIHVLEGGMDIGGEFVQGITVKKTFNKGRRQIVTVILKEGKNRQLRKMFGRLGYDVLSLRRTRIGKLKLGTLSIGKWKVVPRSAIV